MLAQRKQKIFVQATNDIWIEGMNVICSIPANKMVIYQACIRCEPGLR